MGETNTEKMFALFITLHLSVDARCDCLKDPLQKCCDDYKYSEADCKKDIASLCGQMPFMFGCGLVQQCESESVRGPACKPFSLLSNLCVDMPGMSGCATHSKLCQKGTRIKQCKSEGPLPHVLTTAQAKADVIDICSSMGTMDGCSDCVKPNSTCNCADLGQDHCSLSSSSSLVTKLSTLCVNQMPMSGCDDFKDMCNDLTDSDHFSNVCGTIDEPDDKSICNGYGTVMFMNGIKAFTKSHDNCMTFLFNGWLLDTVGKHVGAVIGTVVLGIASVWLISDAPQMWKKSLPKAPKIHPGHHVVWFLLVLLQVTVSYALMLLAMSYYLPLLFSVSCGLSLGHLIFKRDQGHVKCCADEHDDDDLDNDDDWMLKGDH
eukprot:c8965_g1_i1.p1 GENE.c8965_g1_i1~~c8965_g1_i1.p1  ORF type:complete len:375 (-),score=71.75 c8965_g1_i1:429-1553(-)